MADAPDFPLFWAGLNSILFAINIDNKDLNGQSKFAPTVSDLLKESTQNVTSLLKESTQGVSSLFREITASSAVSILIKPEQDTDPLPVVSKHVSAGERDRVWEFEPRGQVQGWRAVAERDTPCRPKAPREGSCPWVFSLHLCLFFFSSLTPKGTKSLAEM